MKRYVLLVLLLVVNVGLVSAWYSGWLYQQNITINATDVSGPVSNFTVLVSIPSDPWLASDAQSNGSDIVFTNTSDGKLAHEIEYYNSTTGGLIAWVLLPNVTNVINQTILLYYGNSTAANQENRSGAWDAYSVGVYHFRASGNGVDGNDSTGKNNLTANVGFNTTNGLIGSGVLFNSSNWYEGDSVATSIRGSTNVTYSAWLKFGYNYNSASPVMVLHDLTTGSSSDDCILSLGRYATSAATGKLTTYMDTDLSGADVAGTTTSWTANTWYYVVGVCQPDPLKACYVNATQEGSVTSGAMRGTGSNSTTFYFGSQRGLNDYLNASIDEVRIANASRSQNWLSTEYNMESPNSAFTQASQETSNTGWFSPSWFFRQNLTINTSQVNGSLLNFPLLVRLSNDSSLATYAQASGNDIFFAMNGSGTNVKLNHELVWYNSSSGALEAWVQVPNLSNASTATLYMYYGNANAVAQQVPVSVWSDHFSGVYHLGNATNLTLNDSTTINNISAWTGESGVSGVAGSGASFTSIGYLSIPTITTAFTNFTVCLWFNSSYAVAAARLVDKSYFTGFWMGEDGAVANSDAWGGGVEQSAFPYGAYVTLPHGSWHFLCIDRNGTTLTVLGDGNISNVSTVSAAATDTSALAFGSENDLASYEYTGMMDEVEISSVARNISYLMTQYNNQVPGSTMLTLGAQQQQPVPFNPSSYKYNRTITVNTTGMQGAQVNFPLAVSLLNDTNFAANTLANGSDIVFTDNKSNLLPFEIESYNNNTGALVAWVLLSALNSSVNQTLYLYYGYNLSLNYGYNLSLNYQNVSGVWSNAYVSVMHFNNGSVTDSVNTSIPNTGLNVTNATGVLGGGAGLNLSSGYSYVNNNVSSNVMNSTGNVTVSMWINLNQAWNDTSSSSIYLFDYDVASSNNQLEITLGSLAGSANGELEASAGLGGGSTSSAFSNDQAWPANQWYYVTGEWDNANNLGYVFENGTQLQSRSMTRGAATLYNVVSYGRQTTFLNARMLNGTIDEVHVSNAIRSATWLTDEYLNQEPNSSVVSASAGASGGGGGGGGSCSPTANQVWLLNASNFCNISGTVVRVSNWTIVGSGNVTFLNSNITYSLKSFTNLTGLVVIRLLSNVSMIVSK